ncbi:MAG: DUF5715 family protein [Candidatus Symbiothrix sp.]|nr:DUF5715 family protein [Candidatus Symbiothrix sp.]
MLKQFYSTKKKSLFCLLALASGAWFFMTCSSPPPPLKPIHYNGNYNKDFNDLNETQLAVAQSIGITPLTNRDAAEGLKNRLTHIASSKNYEVDELTHSIPFLIPGAAQLLNRIADSFADSLKQLNAPHYKLIVTSVTRTQDDVKHLSRSNINASQNSTHLYGTTFDISWRRFVKSKAHAHDLTEDQLKMVLASVLRDLKKQQACFVKHEKKQACFHITARNS